MKSVKFSALTLSFTFLVFSGGRGQLDDKLPCSGLTKVGFEGHTLEISNQYARLRGYSGTDSDQMPPALS